MSRKEDLIDLLEGQSDLYEHKLTVAEDTFERGLWTGRKQATDEALSYVKRALPDIEEEARLIPDVEEEVGSLRERLMAEEMAA